MADKRAKHNAVTPINKQVQNNIIVVKIEAPELKCNKNAEPYKNGKLHDLKTRLNKEKSAMDSLALDERWNTFLANADIYRDLKFPLSKTFGAQNPTNAWYKIYELNSYFKLLPKDDIIVCFFNAELPGTSLLATNHMARTLHRKQDFVWYASSLMPDTKTKNFGDALGDRYGIYSHNPDKWLMSNKPRDGYINNGDVTNINNLLDFAKRIGPDSPVGGVNYYCHDAGIDVSKDDSGGIGYNEQETANARIHLGCAIAAFLTLKPGGNFIGKQYTPFETLTWNLIMIYSTMFDEFYLTKPLTSRSRNSEIYLVGKGFREFKHKELLLQKLENFDMGPLVDEKELDAGLFEPMNDLHRFCRIVFEQQIEVMAENIALFNKYVGNKADDEKKDKGMQEFRDGMKHLKQQQIKRWLDYFPVKCLRERDYIPAK